MRKATSLLLMLILISLGACQSGQTIAPTEHFPAPASMAEITAAPTSSATVHAGPNKTAEVLTSIARVIQTIDAQATLRTPTATRTPRTPTSTITPTPTFDFLSYNLTWRRFHSQHYQLSFEYPSIYDEAPFQERCAPVDGYDGVHIADKSEIMSRRHNGLSLVAYIQQFLGEYYRNHQYQIVSETPVSAGEFPARTVDYRFNESGLEGTFTFVFYNTRALIFSFPPGEGCDIPELALKESDAYQRAIETLTIEE